MITKHILTPGQRNLLNRGPNFVPINLNVNTTDVEVASWQWERKMLWKEFWYNEDSEDENENTSQAAAAWNAHGILKKPEEKINLPRGHSAPVELKNNIATSKFNIMGGRLNRVRDNLTIEEQKGLIELNQMAKDRLIVIKRSDKTGGWVIMNYDDYKAAGDKKLAEKFTENGVAKVCASNRGYPEEAAQSYPGICSRSFGQ